MLNFVSNFLLECITALNFQGAMSGFPSSTEETFAI